MTTTHLTLGGDFEECVAGGCELKFHFPDVTPAEMHYVPMKQLLQLTDIADPPLWGDASKRIWLDADGMLHRDYGLPALVYYWGTAIWYIHGRNQKKRLTRAYPMIRATDKEVRYQDATQQRTGQKYRVFDHAQSRYQAMIGAVTEVQA
jgi:hypothetical protein